MREIKFRAWDEKNKIMCEVKDISFDYGEVVVERSEEKPRENNCGCCDDRSDTVLFLKDGDYSQKKNCILMQSTGLKDKNGKEIYESDVIKSVRVEDDFVNENGSEQFFLAEVKFKEGKWIAHEYPNQDDCEFDLYDYDCEIIGNIHENKDLLK